MRRGLVIGLVVIVVIVVLLAVFVIGGYNGLVCARNAYKNTFAQSDVQLRRRFDLIPKLIEVAKTYMAHERESLEAVVATASEAELLRVACGLMHIPLPALLT